jgi:hypothetical protein
MAIMNSSGAKPPKRTIESSTKSLRINVFSVRVATTSLYCSVVASDEYIGFMSAIEGTFSSMCMQGTDR